MKEVKTMSEKGSAVATRKRLARKLFILPLERLGPGACLRVPPAGAR